MLSFWPTASCCKSGQKQMLWDKEVADLYSAFRNQQLKASPDWGCLCFSAFNWPFLPGFASLLLNPFKRMPPVGEYLWEAGKWSSQWDPYSLLHAWQPQPASQVLPIPLLGVIPGTTWVHSEELRWKIVWRLMNTSRWWSWGQVVSSVQGWKNKWMASDGCSAYFVFALI